MINYSTEFFQAYIFLGILFGVFALLYIQDILRGKNEGSSSGPYGADEFDRVLSLDLRVADISSPQTFFPSLRLVLAFLFLGILVMGILALPGCEPFDYMVLYIAAIFEFLILVYTYFNSYVIKIDDVRSEFVVFPLLSLINRNRLDASFSQVLSVVVVIKPQTGRERRALSFNMEITMGGGDVYKFTFANFENGQVREILSYLKKNFVERLVINLPDK